MILTYDVETSTLNKGNPFSHNAKLVSYSMKVDDGQTQFKYFNEIDFLTPIRAAFLEAKLVVGFNLKFDLHHMANRGVHLNPRCRVWDAQIAEFILTGQQGTYPSLDECLAKYGLPAKDDKVAEYWALGVDTEFIPTEELQVYNDLDVELTYRLYLLQREMMTEKQQKLCMLMGLDLLVLKEMESNGIKFDVELCKEKERETAAELKTITDELLGYAPTPDINLDSGQHLSCWLYGGKFEIDYPVEYEAVYKSGARKGETYIKVQHNLKVYDCPQLFKPLPRSETKLKKKLGSEEITIYFTNEDTLKQLRKPTKVHRRIVQLLLDRAEKAKLLETYYRALPALIDEMEWSGYLHGQYNQVGARTGRLSSNKPNMQNFSGDVDQLLVSRYD